MAGHSTAVEKDREAATTVSAGGREGGDTHANEALPEEKFYFSRVLMTEEDKEWEASSAGRRHEGGAAGVSWPCGEWVVGY